MLESLAAWVLRTYVGEYVENLNTEQLSIGYGGIELENLTLKKTALDAFELPIEVRSGFIGRLKLEIPYSRPKSQPWIICIDKLYIVAGPPLSPHSSKETKQKNEKIRKQQQLDALESQWKASREKQNNGWWSESWWPSLYSSFSTTVAENLQLIINNVHFRYEDAMLNPEKPFSFGITIGHLAARSTDHKWEVKFLHTEDIMKFKLIELTSLAVYWDSDVNLVGNLSAKDAVKALGRSMKHKDGAVSLKNHTYVLEPISGQVRMKRNASNAPLLSKDGPRFDVEFVLEKISLSLADGQFSGFLMLLDEMQRYFRLHKHFELRPKTSVSKSPRDWWRFAINCHVGPIKEKNERRTKVFITQRVTDIILYVKAYTEHLTNPVVGPETMPLRKVIEEKLSFDEIRILRSIVTSRITKEESLRKAAEKTNELKKVAGEAGSSWGGWLTGWTSWYGYEGIDEKGSADQTPSKIKFEGPVSAEEEEFLGELAEAGHNESLFKRDHVFVQLNFKLSSGTLRVKTTSPDGSCVPVAELEFSEVAWVSEVRPKSNSWQFSTTLGALFLRDLYNQNTLFPVLIQPQEKGKVKAVQSKQANDSGIDGLATLLEEKSPLLEISFEQRPAGIRNLYRLSVNLQPLTMTYNKDVMTRLSEFMKPTSQSRYRLKSANIESKVKKMALERYQELKDSTKTELIQSLDDLMSGETKKADDKWDIELDIAAPSIILPEKFNGTSTSMVIFDLGKISFINAPGLHRQRSKSIGEGADSGDEDEFLTPLSTPPDEEDLEKVITEAAFSHETEDVEALKEKFYDRYELKFTHLQVVVCKSVDDWRRILRQKKSEFHVVDSFSISLNMERRLAFTSDPNWPAVTLSGSLPQLIVNVDEHKIAVLFKCFNQLQTDTTPSLNIEVQRPSAKSNAVTSPRPVSPTVNIQSQKEARLSDAHLTPQRELSVLHKRAHDLLVESCLAVANFKIDKVSLGLHSRGRSVAELQVAGVETEYIKRPYDFSVSFVLHSLLIIDAIQTFGPEYRLLVSSREMNTCDDKNAEDESTDALIRINYQQIDSELMPSEGNEKQPQRIASLNFSSVSIIANQETIVELMSVIDHALQIDSAQQHSTAEKETNVKRLMTPDDKTAMTSPTYDQSKDFAEKKLQVDFNVQRVNIMLAHGVCRQGGAKVAQRVAAVTIADLDFSADLGHDQGVKGSLGGLEVLDLTPESTIHRCILAIGDCNQDESKVETSSIDSDYKAFSFTLTKPADNSSVGMDVDSHIASARYVHSAEFLAELSLCAGDFRDYAASAAKSIQTAAADAAKEFVTAKRDTEKSVSPSLKRQLFDDDSVSEKQSNKKEGKLTVRICIDTPVIVIPMSFNSPDLLVGNLGQIAIRNFHIAKAEDGKDIAATGLIKEGSIDRIVLDINNVSLFSITLQSSQLTDLESGRMTTFDLLKQRQASTVSPFSSPSHQFHRPTRRKPTLSQLREESFTMETACDTEALEWIQILHEAGFQLVIDRLMEVEPIMGGSSGNAVRKEPSFRVEGRISRVLKLELSGKTYNQLLETLNAISAPSKQQSNVELNSISSRASRSGTPQVSSPSPRGLSPNKPRDDHEPFHLPDEFMFPSDVEMNIDNQENETVNISHTRFSASFEVVRIDVTLSVEINNKERKFANIRLEDFIFGYNNFDKPVNEVSVNLGELTVEDLLHDGDPSNRFLLKSSNSDRRNNGHNISLTSRLSSSCPEGSLFYDPMVLSTSLPSVLNFSPKKTWQPSISPLRPMMHSDKKFPSQPHLSFNKESLSEDEYESESLIEREKEESWVKIKIMLIDDGNHDLNDGEIFVNKYIDIAFNSLDLTVNLQTWVVVFEFFGIGAPAPQPSSSGQTSPVKSFDNIEQPQESDKEHTMFASQSVVGTDIKVSMKSLSATLNKEKYPLAHSVVSNLNFDVEQRGPDQQVTGSIGYISLCDMSPHGSLYKERFITYGDQALAFTFFRYGEPDPFLKRDFDMRLELKMASVQYVHTQRFLSEVIAFAQHFLQLQEVLGRIRAASQGNEVFAITNRAARVSLNVEADVPILILPRSSFSQDILVACLGHIVVANAFQYAGSPDSISGKLTASRFRTNQLSSETEKSISRLISQESIAESEDRLLDCINIGLVDMEVFTALRTDQSKHENMSFGYERQGGKLMKETCKIELVVERNLEWAFGRQVPDMTIAGKLSSVYVTLDLAQFGLIMGMLGENLGEQFEQFERPSSVLIDPLQEATESDAVWTTLSMSLSLVNVTIEMIPKFSFGDIPQRGDASEQLGKLDFVQSKFVYESFSDGSKSMDLVSHGVLLHDIRSKDNNCSNVFTKILEPSSKYNDEMLERVLQFEVHYLDTKNKTHITCLFNRSKIIVILDFLMQIWNFITRKEENEYREQKEFQIKSKTGELISPTSGDVHPPSGIITKASTTPRKPDVKQFELKVNMTDTEIIVVEDNTSMDTAAVILQTTAVLAYRPNHFSERPLTVSLQSLEVFSCILANIDDTALSIIDPVTVLIELNSAVKLKNQTVNKGLLGAMQVKPTLEVHFHSQLNVRLSYHDIKLFLRIFESAQKQISQAMEKSDESKALEDVHSTAESDSNNGCLLISQKPIYTEEDSLVLDVAIGGTAEVKAASDGEQGESVALAGFEVTGTVLSFCLIDDCGNNDIPLVEILLSNLYLWHDLQHTGEGTSHATVMGDYYNRNVSGWEPFIEPWKCTMQWHRTGKTAKKGERTYVKIHAPERLDLNVTSSLLEMIYSTKSSWTEDYLKDNQSALGESSTDVSKESRTSLAKKRAPFVPFLLRNRSGCPIRFGTLITSPTKAVGNADPKADDIRKRSYTEAMHSWREVTADEEVPVRFESRDKMRHKGTHKLKVHQIVVQVSGWQPSSPVTVDKVGDFFRHVLPAQDNPGGVQTLKSSALRLVFAVSLEGARKVVTVRSSLIISNKLDVPMEIWAENVSEETGLKFPTLNPGSSFPVPVSNVQWNLYVRPGTIGNFDYCQDRLEWRDVVKPYEGRGYLRECHGKQKSHFRFACFVMREGFPVDKPSNFTEAVEKKVFMHPGHTISLVHHLILVNLLPVELLYIIKGGAKRERIKSGKSVPLHNVDARNTFEIGFSFESHTRFEYVRISTRYRIDPAVIPVKLLDVQGRPIILNLKIEHEMSSAKISVYSPYWLVNKTGIPLVFRREGETVEAAGQFEEHEKARSLTPLLFSYVDEESMFRCQMRVGRDMYQGPLWCNSFSLESVRDHRTLYIRQGGNKPEITFDIGINSVFGQGQLFCTRIVSFVTKFQLENRSRYSLAFAQRHMVKGEGTVSPDGCVVSLPGAITLFHWPRSDFDPLLCVRLHDIDHCYWSGGFKIDKECSFHVNMRSSQSASFMFLRVEVVLEGATFHVILADTDQLPPPFRIDNLSRVEVTFWQSRNTDRSQRCILKPKHSVPYALDEPSFSATLAMSVFGEMSDNYDMMTLNRDLPRLYYQNAIYIALGSTFSPYDCMTENCNHGAFVSLEPAYKDRQLVLDVVEGQKVVLSRKVLHKRSQLWRMNAKGQLLHVGSSSPFDPRQTSPKGKCSLVLDIAGNYSENRGFAPLVLARSDPRREMTQTWNFEDGLLCCGLVNMAVRPLDGVSGLQEGNLAVLAPLRRPSGGKWPADNCLCKHKLRPGSGALVVRVTTDGPTRVVRITDACDEMASDTEQDWTLVEKRGGASKFFTLSAQTSPYDSELQVNVSLAHGFGLSVINSIPEEIVFATFHRIQLDYLSVHKNKSLEFVVDNIQIDNQLFGSSYPVLLFPTPLSMKGEVVKETPAIEFSVCLEESSFANVDIYRKFDFSLRKMTILLEDRTLLKLLQFFGTGDGSENDLKSEDFDIHSSQRILETQNRNTTGKKIYLERLFLGSTEAKISLLTVGRLTPDLHKIKRSLGFPIVSLEDANIELTFFKKEHLFETTSVIMDQVKRHYSDVVRGQAASVLGSLDILGNPMGLIHDVSTGMEGLVKRGNLGGLLVNVAHGLSDTAAKMTGSIADGLWTASMDSRLQESRGVMRAERGSSSSDHLLAGIKGLGMGVIGGLTSMVTQPIEGASRKGVQGFFTGIGKGLVGTVAKPAAGVLDLASGAAAAVRGSARGRQYAPKPVRLKRNCFDAGGVLPGFSKSMAEGQDVLLKLNECDITERFVASELVRSDKDDRMRSIITTDGVYFVKAKGPPSSDSVVLHLEFSELFTAQPRIEKGSPEMFVELIMRRESNGEFLPSRNPDKRPRVRCDSKHIAEKVTDKINYMKSLYAEKQLTVLNEKNERT